jgi:hypothetical protein
LLTVGHQEGPDTVSVVAEMCLREELARPRSRVVR